MASEEEIQLAEKLNSLKNDELALNEELAKLNERQLEALTKLNTVEEEIAKKAKLLLETQRQSVDYAERRYNQTFRELEKVKELLETEKSRYAQSIIQQEHDKLNAQLRRDEIELIRQQIREGKKADVNRLKHLEDTEKKLEMFGDNASDIAQGLFSGNSDKIVGALKNIGNSMKADLTNKMKESIKGADSLGGALKAAASTMVILGMIEFARVITKLAYDLGNVEKSFMKATGASQEFASSISRTYEEGRKFAATAEDMSKAAQGLYNEFTDFTFQDVQTRESLIETGAVLEKLGISNDKFAKSIQLSTKALGMSADQAGQEMLNLEKYAEELGVSPERLSSQFLEAGDSLAKLGENGDKAFRDLAAAAKVTGLEVNKLLNIVNKFDTFEGAARQAGKLNAALGGNFVNAMDLMMETDPTARFEQIRDAILDTGLSFDEMSYYQKNFYKDALGLSDVGELALVLSGNMDAVGEATKKTSQEYEEAANRAREVASFQEQLNIMFAKLIPIITPLIGFMHDFFAALSGSEIKEGQESISYLGYAIYGLVQPIKWIGDGIKMVIDFFAELSGKIGMSKETLETLATVAKVVGMILGGVLVAKLLLLAKPVIAVTVGVLALFGAFKALGKMLFKEQFASSFLDGLGKIANAFASISTGALEILNPVKMVTKLVEALGNTFKMVIESIKGFFEILANPVMAENIMNIGEAITAIPTRKNLEFVASMGAAATAGTAAAAVAGVGTAVGGAVDVVANVLGATSQSDGSPQEITINLMVDRDKLATVVHKINGKTSRKAIAGRG